MEEKNYEAIVEAILFTMGESVELEKIAAALELDKKETKKIIENACAILISIYYSHKNCNCFLLE